MYQLKGSFNDPADSSDDDEDNPFSYARLFSKHVESRRFSTTKDS